MPGFPRSIRKKASYGYYIGVGLMAVVALVNYFNLIMLDKKIAAGMAVSEFFDSVLEMRRYEKNYILYRDRDDYLENLRFTEKASAIIRNNMDAFKGLEAEKAISGLKPEIAEYKSLMERYFAMDKILNPVGTYTIEGGIREKGRRIVTRAEDISAKERSRIQSLVTSSRRILVVSVVFLIAVGCFMGRYLSRMVVRPLKEMENQMKRISEGKFDALHSESSDMEVVSLGNAFNRMLKELEMRQKRLIFQSEKLASLGMMISGIVHQINNPLSNIYSSCQILREEIDESDTAYKKELLIQIEEEIERTKLLIRSLLDFSKKKDFKSEPLPLKELISDTLRLIRGDIPPKVEVSVDIPDDIWIAADKQRMEQALMNIIKNGIDAIPDEGKVTISAREDAGAKTTVISIRDTGLGIEAADIEKIFEPFYTTKADDKGTGLGLYVSREIIKEHEGVIEVYSTPGEGTTFTIKLPM